MVMTGVLGAVALVALGPTKANRVVIAAKNLRRDLTFARQRAVATGVNSWVLFDATENTWTIQAENTAAPGKAGAITIFDSATAAGFVTDLDDAIYAGTDLLAVTIDAGNDIGFDWLGRPLNAAETALAADAVIPISYDGQNWEIRVRVDTGHIYYVPP